MEPGTGVEPATLSLQMRCTAIVLPWRICALLYHILRPKLKRFLHLALFPAVLYHPRGAELFITQRRREEESAEKASVYDSVEECKAQSAKRLFVKKASFAF